MLDRKSHSGKSRLQREYYKKEVAKMDFEQTANENMNFDNSDSTKPVYDISNYDNVRRPSPKVQLWDFLKDHIIGIIFTTISTIIIAIFTLFAINLNRESGEHEHDLTNIKETISDLKININNNSEIITNIKISDANISKDIEYMKKNISKIESDINTLESKIK